MRHTNLRHWNRPTDLRSLLHIEPTFPTTSLEFRSAGLNGDITGYKEVTQAAAPRTALNSTSVDRKPSSYTSSFVRGKSSYFPFRPGGLAEGLGLDDEDEGLEGAAEGLEKAFEKGRGESWNDRGSVCGLAHACSTSQVAF